MRIEQIYVDGYGLFCDFQLDDLSPASTVILGPNESGKTTLLSFIRTILFGFLDRRSTENLYEPLRGGRHGGLLGLLDNQNERFTLERHAGRKGGKVTLTLPDGALGDTDSLAAVLGHTSRDLFRNVFAFSLSELQDFETLSSDDVRARIYGAGFGTGRMGLPEIESTIENEQGKLYKEGGRKQTIAALVREANEVRTQLREFDNQVEEHVHLRSDLERLNREIDEKSEERQHGYAERDHIANLLRGWDDWTEFRSAQAQLEDLPEVNEFPEQGIIRLERLHGQNDDLRNRIEEFKNSITSNEDDLGKLVLDEQVLGSISKVEGLNRGLDKYESAKQDLPKRDSELKSALEDLEEGLRVLGPGWDELRVKGFDTSVLAREAVRSHGEELKESSGQLHDAERDEERASDELEKISAEHARLEKKWKALEPPLEPNGTALEERRQRIRELRSLVSAHERLGQEKDHLEDRKNDLETRCVSLGRQISREAASLPFWPAVVVPVIGLLAGVAFAGAADWITAAAIAGFGVILGAGYAFLRTNLATGSQQETLKSELKTLLSRLKEIEEQTAATASRDKEAEHSLSALVQELGISGNPDNRDIDRLENALETALAALGVWETEQKRVKEAADQIDQLKKRVCLGKETADKARDQRTRVTKAWHAWLEEREIDRTTRPETCLELFSMVESLRQKIKAVDGLRQRITAIKEDMGAYEARTNATRQACGLPEKARSEFPGAVDQLVEVSRTAKGRSERAEQLQKVIDKDTAALRALKTRAQELGEEIAQLLSEARASDEEDFRKRAKIFEQREALLAAVRDRKKNLERIAGRDRLETFLGELEAANPEQLQQMQREVGERITEIEKDLEAKSRECGKTNEQIRVIESEKESSELRLRQSILREQLQIEAQRWSVLTIGRALLAETRLKYERERQPAVIQEAQRFFSTITSGRYERILSLPGENRIAVEDQIGTRKDSSELSRGTVEQLYLALRFGLVREFGRRSEPMPVIMDDILVNFDPDRARETCKALGELSRDQQVILFTCHPETVDLITAQTKDCKLITLPSEAC